MSHLAPHMPCSIHEPWEHSTSQSETKSVKQSLSRLHLDLLSTFSGPHVTSAERNSTSPEMVSWRTCL